MLSPPGRGRNREVDALGFSCYSFSEVRPEGDPPEDAAGRTNPRLVKIAKYAAIGLQFPSTIIGGFVLGYLVDNFLGTSPWFLIVFTFLAFIGAVVQLIQLARRFGAEK